MRTTAGGSAEGRPTGFQGRTMLNDRHLDFSLTAFLAWIAWIAADAALLAAWGLDDIRHALILSQIAAITAAAAATLHVRSFMCVFAHRMKAAFELGREVERQHQVERGLRSV